MLRCRGGQKGHGIRTDCKESHISQVKQPCQANHNIQPQAEQNVDKDSPDGVVPIYAGHQWHQKDQHQENTIDNKAGIAIAAHLFDERRLIESPPGVFPVRHEPDSPTAAPDAAT